MSLPLRTLMARWLKVRKTTTPRCEPFKWSPARDTRDQHRLASPLKPPDRKHGGERRRNLESKNEEGLSARRRKPLDDEEPDHRHLAGYEQLPQMRRRYLVGLAGSPEDR